MSVTITLNGLVDFQAHIDRLPEVTRAAARMAVNQTAERKALSLSREKIASQVSLSKEYLKDKSRIGVSKPATEADLEAIITARHRPTSLARFAADAKFPTAKGEEIQVKVKPGQTKTMKRAFIVKLPAGKGDVPTDNRGLAVRLAEGKTLRESHGAVKLAPNVYLLYGPSVNQVFNTVREDIQGPVSDYLADEFLRQFARLARE